MVVLKLIIMVLMVAIMVLTKVLIIVVLMMLTKVLIIAHHNFTSWYSPWCSLY